MSRWTQFLEVKGELSMRNLTVLVTIAVASFVVTYMALEDTLSEGIFIAYLMAGGGVYAFGKQQDESTERSRIESQNAPANVTNINKAEQVNTAP